MLGERRRRLRSLPINHLLPNVLTVLALCAGMTSMRFALQERWEPAVLAIVVAGVLDGLDGRIARLLHGATRFGAELDSLSDFIAFGVAPALLLYLWSSAELGGFGWIAALGYATCAALRLARFNVALDDTERPAWSGHFFTGVAAPAAAGLVLLPLMLSFTLGDLPWRSPILVTAWLFCVGWLMVSRVPTWSLKRVRVRREHILALLLLVGFAAAMTVSYPWLLLPAVGVFYLASMPFSIRAHHRLKQGAATAVADGPAGGAGDPPA